MNSIYRLKSSIDKKQLDDRLQYNPHTIELHLLEDDLKSPRKISGIVNELKSCGINVILHHPFTMRGNLIDINTEGFRRDLYFLQLGLMSQLADELDVKVIFHGNYLCEDFYVDQYLSDETYKRIENVKNNISRNILWENAMWSSFSFTNSRLIDEIIKPLNLPICFDISHAFIDFKGDNEKLLQAVIELDDYIEHFHVVDSKGIEHDALPLGDGLIDWKLLKPYIEKKSYIFEVGLRDLNDCENMVRSSEFFSNL